MDIIRLSCDKKEYLSLLLLGDEQGYGRMMLEEIKRIYSGHKLLVGTGETPSTLQFYNKCGFVYSHRITDFFTINYNHIIIEDGIILKDMIYLKSDNTATNHVTTPER